MDLAPVFGPAHLPAGLALYPRVNTLFASDRAIRALSTEQQEAIRLAAADALDFALEDLPEQDDAASFCAAGGEVVVAQPADVDAIIAAAQPVIAVMEADQVTKGVISDIRTFKESTPDAPALVPCSNLPASTPTPTPRTDAPARRPLADAPPLGGADRRSPRRRRFHARGVRDGRRLVR